MTDTGTSGANASVEERTDAKSAKLVAAFALALSTATPFFPGGTSAVGSVAQPSSRYEQTTSSPSNANDSRTALRARYMRMSRAEWFVEAYEDKSLGESIPVAG